MKEAKTEKLLKNIIVHYSSNTKLLVHHIKDAKKNWRPVLGALINLIAQKANMTPKVNGIEQMLPQTVWCQPMSVQNITAILNKIGNNKYGNLELLG